MGGMTNHLMPWIGALLMALAIPVAAAATPAALLDGYRAAASSTPDAARGERFFAQTHGREWSCASCHGVRPVRAGRHAVTAKPIAPLAPAFDAQRFTDAAKSDKWFRRNCGDVLGRDCSPAERADVLAWLLTLKP